MALPSSLAMTIQPGSAGSGVMIPMRSQLLLRMLRSGWAVGALALVFATLLEWGLISRN